MFDENVTTHAAFLANGLNKMRLLTMLSNKLALRRIQVEQAEADADRLIVSSIYLSQKSHLEDLL